MNDQSISPLNDFSQKPTVALLHWGDLWEDFLDSIGVSFDAFCNEMTGGWMFGYIEALQQAGFRTILFCISGKVSTSCRYEHVPTGTPICVLPAMGIYLKMRTFIPNPYGWTLNDALGNRKRRKRRFHLALIRHVLPYVATPFIPLARELRRENCRAIICQEYEYARFDICVLLGKLLKIPVFASFQGGNFQLSRLEGWIRPFMVNSCSGLIIATQTEIERVSETYRIPKEKITQIFNPMDVTNWYPFEQSIVRAELGIPSDARVAIYHGRVDMHRKGLDILTSAWDLVCRDRPHQDLRLVLVGTGSDANLLRDRINQMDLRGVIWVNEYVRDRIKIRQYLSSADVYVFASRHEGFPVAPIEAMACELPIVSTDAPGIPDILKDGEDTGGIMVPRNDPKALAIALGRIIDNPEWGKELGKRARKQAEEKFSFETISRQLRTCLMSKL